MSADFLPVLNALQRAKGPCRELDRLVASTLSPDMPWRGRPLGNRHLAMAFTRGVENADRFMQIALPGYDWSVGSNRKTGDYHAIIWGPSQVDDTAEGNTPALALLACAMMTGIEEKGWPSAPGIEAEGRNTEGGSVHESPTTVGRAPDPIPPIPAPAGQGQIQPVPVENEER